MRFDKSQLLLLGLAVPAYALPQPRVPHLHKRVQADPKKAQAVKDAFKLSWKGYYDNAFPHDNLHPVSNGYDDDRNGWGVTPVDSLSTAIIMKEADIVNQILEFIPSIDFTTTAVADEDISVFETNIRYLGGLISAYDLLKDGPYSDLVSDSSLVEPLLDQAVSLADSLSTAFKTPSGVPDPVIQLNPEPRINGTGVNNAAEAGTLVLEWTRLSDLTGDKKYAKLAQDAEQFILKPTGVPEAFPGLVGTYLSVDNGSFVDNEGGWSGLTDSFYEYLIKMYLYDPKEFAHYKDRWILAADSTMEHLASHPTSRDDLTFLSQYSGQQTIPTSGHLASFAGGNFILGGILLNEQKYLDFGLTLADSYFEPYRKTAAGIGPEQFQWVDAALPSNDTNNPPPPGEAADFYASAGFWTTTGQYILRPETSESLYYAYRLTGDRYWQDQAWQAFEHITDKTRVGSAFASLQDVSKEDGGGFDDLMQSFWLAETLAYLYLVFADESPVQVVVDGHNGWVYNTEAHPVKVRG